MGYIGYSMSERAAAAYEDNRMPLSKWTKGAILEALEDKKEMCMKYSAAVLKRAVLTCSEWHHTGKMFNCTDFYQVDEDKVEILTEERLEEIANAIKSEKEAKQRRNEERTLCRIKIDEYEKVKGWWKHYEVFDYGIKVDGWIYTRENGKKKTSGKNVTILETFARSPKGHADDFKRIRDKYGLK